MSDPKSILEQYAKAVRFPEVSGFEVLELLDLRSQIAEQEKDLAPLLHSRLEEADSTFLQNAHSFFEALHGLGELEAHRQRTAVPCSHWWWYLDRFVQSPRLAAV